MINKIILVLLTIAMLGCNTTQPTNTAIVEPTIVKNDKFPYLKVDIPDDDPILNLKVPEDWKIVGDYSGYRLSEREYINFRASSPYNECIDKWITVGTITSRNEDEMLRCSHMILQGGNRFYPTAPIIVLKKLAYDDNDRMQFKVSTNHSYDAYVKQSFLAGLATWYAMNYNLSDITLTDAERARIDNYIVSHLMKNKLQKSELSNTSCVVFLSNPENAARKEIDFDPCGSIALKIAPAEILLGLRLKNQELFSKGNQNIFNALAMIDSNGIYVPYAMKGGKSYSYYVSGVKGMSLIVEIYKSVGFDLLSYQLPHGKTVKEYYDKAYTILAEDFHIMDNYSSRSYRKDLPFHTVKNWTQDKIVAASYINGFDARKGGHFYAIAPEYVARYRPELIEYIVNHSDIQKQAFTDGYWPITAYPLHISQ